MVSLQLLMPTWLIVTKSWQRQHCDAGLYQVGAYSQPMQMQPTRSSQDGKCCEDACVSVAGEGGGAGNRAERSTTAKEKLQLPKNEPKVGQVHNGFGKVSTIQIWAAEWTVC